MAQKPSIPKGTRDFSPVEMAKRNYIFNTIREVFHLFGYQQIETPSMENLSTLMGKYGDEGDKLLFKIQNSGDYFSGLTDEELLSRNAAKLASKFCEKGFGPDDRKTPAYTKEDGVDYIPMKGWKNALINLLNIAGTGPIFGPIQGILFGPIAFITIPIGNIIGGAVHESLGHGESHHRVIGTQSYIAVVRKYAVAETAYFAQSIFFAPADWRTGTISAGHYQYIAHFYMIRVIKKQ